MQRTRSAANFLKAAHFDRPEWIPCGVGIMPATWMKYREQLEDIVLRHPRIFPGYEKGSKDFDLLPDERYRKGRFTDNWGCTWENVTPGLDAVVIGSPLEDWSDLQTYRRPDPITQGDGWGPLPDWKRIERDFARTKANGGLARAWLPHGFMYMRLWYLRGFENFMLDVATDEPRLQQLTDMIYDYNMREIDAYLEAGAECMSFGDDLGFQQALPISPEKFRQYLVPCYSRMFGRCREAGAVVYLHSDGHILEIIPDLIQCGVQIINPQIRANTLNGLQKYAKGKVCINLDLDRQLFPFATPQQLDAHIREAVDALGSDEGGLMLYAECEPDIPLENVEAICRTFEEVGGPSV